MTVSAETVYKPAKDIIYSILSLLLYNGVIQFAVYPFFNREMGATAFGVILSLHSFLIIIAGACGSAANNSRMVTLLKYTPSNGDYNFVLFFLSLGSFVVGGIYFVMALPEDIKTAPVVLYCSLMFFMLLRYYGDVEFRLRIDFKRYFIYYSLISVGYCLGLYIYSIINQWAVVFIAGEIMAICYVVLKGHVFSPPIFGRTKYTAAVWKSIICLLTANLISLLIVNADRILLLFYENGASVTAYYVASLLGKMMALLTGPLSGVLLSYLVKYDGSLSNRIFLKGIGLILVTCAVAFICCFLLSPWFIRWMYPTTLEMAKPIIALAIAGQILFFASGILKTVILRFYAEKFQAYLNIIYCVSFFALTTLSLILGDLNEFAWAVLIANAGYFFLLSGFGLYNNKKAVINTDELLNRN